MFRSAFQGDDARRAITEAVKAAEAKTAAEFVVAMRPHSGAYRDLDFAAGAALAFVTLGALLFSPIDFGTDWWPVDIAGAFAAGALACHALPPLRRLLASAARRRSQVRSAARDLFFELGVGKTSRKSGVLVFVSHFEKSVELVADSGIDAAKAAESLTRGRVALESSLDDPKKFAAALAELGASLGAFLPRGANDADELPDAPDVA